MSPISSGASRGILISGIRNTGIVTSVPATIVTDGLVLNLDAGNSSSYPGSGTTWTDLSGGGNNGTLINGVGYSSSNQGSLTFNGSNQYVTVPFSASFPTGSSSRTLSAFFNASTVSGGREIFGIGQNTAPGVRSSLWIDSSNKIGVECLNGGVLTSSWSGINNWVHLCAVLPSGSTIAQSFLIYVNGNLTSGETFGTNTTLNTTNFQCVIGTVPQANSAHMFSGNISQVSMYNRALTASEVLQNFNALKGRYGL